MQKKYSNFIQHTSGDLKSADKTSKRIFWVALALILAAFGWPFIAPNVIDISSDLGAYLDVGGMALLIVAGLALLTSRGFNIVNLIRPGMREPKD